MFFLFFPSGEVVIPDLPGIQIESGDWNELRTVAAVSAANGIGAFYAGGFNPQAFLTSAGTLVIVSGNWSQTRTATAGARGQGITIASGNWDEMVVS